MNILYYIKKIFGRVECRRSKAWCECGNDVLGDELSEVYEGGSFTNIICSKCGRQTKWDLDAPVPIKLDSIPRELSMEEKSENLCENEDDRKRKNWIKIESRVATRYQGYLVEWYKKGYEEGVKDSLKNEIPK